MLEIYLEKLMSLDIHGWTFDSIIGAFVLVVGGGAALIYTFGELRKGTTIKNSWSRLPERIHYFLYGFFIAWIIVFISIIGVICSAYAERTDILNIIISFLRIVVPILIIVLSTIGYLYGKKQEMKKGIGK